MKAEYVRNLNCNYQRLEPGEQPDEKRYQYKCIGLVGGNPIYATPKSDNNNNVYVLVKNNAGKFELIQIDKDFTGFGENDTQN